MQVDETIRATEARAKLSELLNRVAYAGERIGLTRRGKTVAVLVPVDDLARLAHLADLEDLDAVAETEEAPAVPLAQLLERYGIDAEKFEHVRPLVVRR